MKFLKKSLSLLLVLCMLLGFLPVSLLVPEAKAAEPDDFYKIVQVDAGRKYWSLSVLEELVDHMAINGYNQLGLYFSDNQGFRLQLDDMIVQANEEEYDLGKALGNGIYQLGQSSGAPMCKDKDPAAHFRPSLETTDNYLTQANMADLIQYAKNRGIEIVPTFDMPGHMGAILKQFPKFKIQYNGNTSNSTLDVTSTAAVNFALAVLRKYVTFFAGQGCRYFNICSDEFCYDLNNHANQTSQEATDKIVEFMDKAAQIIDEAGMTPRAYSDYMYMHSDGYTYSDAYNKFEVIFWDTTSSRTLEKVKAHNLTIINGDEKAYYALGSLYYTDATTKAGVENYTPTHANTMEGGFDLPYANGAQFHIWCDRGYYDSEVAVGGDAGETVLEKTKGYMESFANSLVKAGHDKTVTINLPIGGTFTVGVFDGDRAAEDWKTGLGLYDVSCVDVETKLTREAQDAQVSKELKTTLSYGDTVVIGNGLLYLTLNIEAKTVSITDDPTKATAWTCENVNNTIRIQNSDLYLNVATNWSTNEKYLSVNSSKWDVPSWTLDGTTLKSSSGQYINLTSDGATIESVGSGVGAYSWEDGQTAQTTVSVVGKANGTATFTYDGTTYTIIVGDVTTEDCTHVGTLVHHDREEPTETKPGMLEYWQCSKCLKYFTDESAQYEVKKSALTIEKLAHTHTLTKVAAVAPTTKTEGRKEHYECSGCQKLFLDAKGTQETTEAALVVPKIESSDEDTKSYSVTVEVGASKTGTATTTKTQDTGITAGSTYSVTDASGNKIADYTVTVERKEEQESGATTEGEEITAFVEGTTTCYIKAADGSYLCANGTFTTDKAAAAVWNITKNAAGLTIETGGKYLQHDAKIGDTVEYWNYGTSTANATTNHFNYATSTPYDNGLYKWGNGITVHNSVGSSDVVKPYAAETSSGTKVTVYTYTPTFTGVKAGTGKVTIGGAEYTVTVTAPHVHDSFTEEDYTCKGAYCTGCGQYVQGTDENPKAYVNPDNHVGGTEIRGSKPSTNTTEGYTGDTYCKGCNTMISEGKVIPAGRTIELMEHEVYEFDVASEGRLELIHTTPDPRIDFISATFIAADPGEPTTKVTDIAQAANGQKLYVTDGTRYLVLNEDNTLSVTTEEKKATQWTVYVNGNAFQLVCREMALAGSSDSADGSQVTVLPYADVSGWGKNDWVLTGESVQREYATKEFLDLRGNKPVFTKTNANVGVYTPSTAKPARTHVKLTAGTEGVSFFTLGGVRYNVIVKKEDVSGKSLTVEKFVTNQHMTDNETEKDYKDTPERRTEVIQAAEGTVNTEGGMLLAQLIPTTGMSNGIDAVYWKGTLQPEGKHQQCWVAGCQGTTDGDHTKSEGVEDFRYIRYYAGAWAVSWDGSKWIEVESTDQVVARYVLKTEVTKEVTTETQDWGYFSKGSVAGKTWVQLDFAVKYEAGTVNPDPSSYPIAGKTLYYHADMGLDHNGQKVTQITDGGSPTTKRRLDTIIGMETSEREVYMITVTQSSNDIHEEWTDNKDYQGDERIVWLKSVDEAHDPSLTYDENLFSLGTKASAGDIAKYLPGLNLDHQEKDPTTYDTAGLPYVDYVYAYNHQGVLVTYYVRAKQGQEKLRVHYLEWFGSEENSQQFYQYGMITKENKFNDSFAMDMTQPDLLVGNTVTSNVGVPVTVTGVLTKMPAVPAKYRTGEYNLVKVVRTDTDVFLYYTGTGLERYVVADFGLPLELAWENVFRTMEESSSFKFIGMKYMNKNFSDEGYSYEVAPLRYGTITNGTTTQDGLYKTLIYTPTKVFTGNEETFYVAVTMEVPVTTDGTTTWERTTKYCAIHVLPATTVYYEPLSDFMTVSNNGWTVTNGDLSGQRQGTYSVLKDTHNPYGFDSAYEKTTGASADVEMTAVSSNAAAKFEFTGTGVEVYANCTKNTGLLMATLSQKQNDGSFKTLRGFIVDTKLGEGTTAGTNFQTWENAYSVPVVALKDLDYGTYKMSLYEISKRGETRDHVRIDGIRVTDPVKEQINRIVYSQVQEMDPKFLEIRDLVLAAVTLPKGKDSEYKNDLAKDLNSQVQGNVKSISGFVVNESPVAESVSLDVLDNGPKNEFYLQKDQSLVLAVSKDYEYQVGMKSIDGELVYGDKTLGTTDLYYKVTKTTTKSGTILTITNTGNGVLVLTKLKCLPASQSYNTSSGTAALSDMISTFTAESMAQAIMALTETDADEEQPAEPDPGQPENPEEPKEPENPQDPKDPQDSKDSKDSGDSIVKKVSDFKDVDETDWFYEPVKLVSESGLMVGVADDRFGPNIPLTRAMMVQILYTVEGSEPNDGKIKFRDVDPGDWYAKAVCWAYEQGIVSGTSDTTFDPNKPITREQMVAILYRYADHIGMQPEAKGSVTAFPDCGSVSAWAEDAMRWAVSAKIIAGSGGKIQPQGTATRAQVATVLKGFADWFVIREGELGY